MKHLLIGLSLVAAVTGFCLWSASYVRGAVEETARLLEAAYEAAEADQFSQARAAVQAASDTWDRYGGYFGTVLRHDEIDGVVDIDETHRTALRNITVTADDGEVKQYQVPYSVGLRVENGQRISKGDRITDGALSPHDVLRISGEEAVQEYLTQEVLAVYRQQGVDINDKHIEVIIRQMMRKVRVEDAGDSELLSGSTIDLIEFLDAEAEIQKRIDAGEKNAEGEELRKPTCTRLLMGITKASLATDSWMSAASFQETTKVLTEAAIRGKVDHLRGLKENVIIGKLIPAGSGLAQYRKFDTIDDEGNLTSKKSGSIVADALEAPAEDEEESLGLDLLLDDGEDGEDSLFEEGAITLDSDQPQEEHQDPVL